MKFIRAEVGTIHKGTQCKTFSFLVFFLGRGGGVGEKEG